MDLVPQTTEPQTLILGYQPPYDWGAILSFLATRSIPGIDRCHDGTYTRTIEIHGKDGILKVHNDTAKNALIARLHTASIVNLLPIVQRLRSLFDLDADPQAANAVLSADRRLAPLVAQAPGLRLPGSWDTFELIIRAILGQQITVAAARTIATRLVERYGHPLRADMDAPFDNPRLFPDCHALAKADIQGIGIPGRRAQTLKAFAQAVATGELNLDPGVDSFELSRQLLAIKGIGKWTVGYVQLRALKDPDAFPSGDIALLRAAQRLGIAQAQPQL
ncbi:MAG: DNA-3-methyladenine glycosylase family protein, partial [Alphaproteobacteria bacterium]